QRGRSPRADAEPPAGAPVRPGDDRARRRRRARQGRARPPRGDARPRPGGGRDGGLRARSAACRAGGVGRGDAERGGPGRAARPAPLSLRAGAGDGAPVRPLGRCRARPGLVHHRALPRARRAAPLPPRPHYRRRDARRNVPPPGRLRRAGGGWSRARLGAGAVAGGGVAEDDGRVGAATQRPLRRLFHAGGRGRPPAQRGLGPGADGARSRRLRRPARHPPPPGVARRLAPLCPRARARRRARRPV
ncbi:MAG: hypothetical protein AVDCRST_MAG88-3469, partial [uncultured Thermomicrobiales bacterium]